MSHYIGGSLIAAKGDNMNIDELNKAKKKLRKIYEKNNPKIEELDEYGNPIEPTGNLSTYKSMGSEYEANKIVGDLRTTINRIMLLSGHFVEKPFNRNPYNAANVPPGNQDYITITSPNSIPYIYSTLNQIKSTMIFVLEMLQDLKTKNRFLFNRKLTSISNLFKKCYNIWRNEFAENFVFILKYDLGGNPQNVIDNPAEDPYEVVKHKDDPRYSLISQSFQKASDKWTYNDFFLKICETDISFKEDRPDWTTILRTLTEVGILSI